MPPAFVADAPLTDPQPVVKVEWFAGEGRRAFGTRYQNIQLGLTTVVFACSVPALWVFGYTFWVLLETLGRVLHLPRGQSGLAWLLAHLPRSGLLLGAYGWALDGAFLLGTLATWALLYFAFDYLPLLGNGSAQRLLAAKVAAFADAPRSGATRFWVELRPQTRRTRLVPDIGYLYLLPEGLRFLGDVQQVSVPRACLMEVQGVRGGRGGVGATYLPLQLASPWNVVRLIGRDRTRTISGTRGDTERLATALATWLAAGDTA